MNKDDLDFRVDKIVMDDKYVAMELENHEMKKQIARFKIEFAYQQAQMVRVEIAEEEVDRLRAKLGDYRQDNRRLANDVVKLKDELRNEKIIGDTALRMAVGESTKLKVEIASLEEQVEHWRDNYWDMKAKYLETDQGRDEIDRAQDHMDYDDEEEQDDE